MFDEFLSNWSMELIYIFRIILAGLCGVILGRERSKRHKEAGVRTHFVVSAGSCLIMCVSMYFADDGARIAAQIVSGIGFLGSGMIIFRKESLQGLTTAAGIWATAGIGMAMGTGMYILGFLSTVVFILMQTILHTKILSNNRTPQFYQLLVKLNNDNETLNVLKLKFDIDTFYKFKIYSQDDKSHVEVIIKTRKDCSANTLTDLLNSTPSIYYIERIEEV